MKEYKHIATIWDEDKIIIIKDGARIEFKFNGKEYKQVDIKIKVK